MPRFFCETANDERLLIEGEDARHITKSLRMRIGDSVTVCCNSIDYQCNIVTIGNVVELDVVGKTPNLSEPTTKITLYQGLPKTDKLDFIIQKAVELGVTEIVPMLTQYCVSRLDSTAFLNKLPRYNKIALEAAKQSGRGIIPSVRNIITYSQAIHEIKNDNQCCGLLYYEKGGTSTGRILSPNSKRVSILIGSEGGFSPDEVEQATSGSIRLATLGRLILRCETAPIVALTLVLNATENIGDI